jgi:hydrogenase nickel incorporation protein HypB
MCETCGCGEPSDSRTVAVEQDILFENNTAAQKNRKLLEEKHILALNLVSSPGSGKTTILERTIEALKQEIPIHVIDGDQEGTLDADRILKLGVGITQINTRSGCHLDAMMIATVLEKTELTDHSLLLIENVGNLVCPAMFDLGESSRVLIMSVTEGEDKPVKYPYMFRTSQLCLVNKTDLLPYLDYNMDLALENMLKVNPRIEYLLVSAKSMEGMDAWMEWLRQEISKQ